MIISKESWYNRDCLFLYTLSIPVDEHIKRSQPAVNIGDIPNYIRDPLLEASIILIQCIESVVVDLLIP